MENNNIDFGYIIEYWCVKSGMTIRDLLEKSNVWRSTYYNSKSKKKFNTQILQKFADVLGVDIVDLVRYPKDVTEMQIEIEAIRERLKEIKNKL